MRDGHRVGRGLAHGADDLCHHLGRMPRRAAPVDAGDLAVAVDVDVEHTDRHTGWDAACPCRCARRCGRTGGWPRRAGRPAPSWRRTRWATGSPADAGRWRRHGDGWRREGAGGAAGDRRVLGDWRCGLVGAGLGPVRRAAGGQQRGDPGQRCEQQGAMEGFHWTAPVWQARSWAAGATAPAGDGIGGAGILCLNFPPVAPADRHFVW